MFTTTWKFRTNFTMKWKTDLPSIGRNYSFALLLLLLFAAHLPFLNADPDLNISFSRDAFTDEGLNTIQIRNWINHGHLDLSECDNLLKTPLLGFPLALTYKIFGTSHLASRLHVLVLLLLALWIISRDNLHRGFLLIFAGICLLQYQVFQYSHFSLAEMLSSAAILLAIHFLSASADAGKSPPVRIRNAILSGTFISLAYYFKIQFIYMVGLIPLVLLFYILVYKPHPRRIVVIEAISASATLLIFLLLYYFVWYLPNRSIYNFMMANQSGEFSISIRSLDYLGFNLKHFFLTGWMLAFVIAFGCCIIAGIYLLYKPGHSTRFPILFLSSLLWIMLESHKLLMVYLPTRYRVSLYVAIGLMISIVLDEALRNRNIFQKVIKYRSIKLLAFSIIGILLFINVFNYISTLSRRSFVIRDTNILLAKTVKPEETVLGAWAPSLTWDCKAMALPVWNNFLHYKDPITNYKPRVVIAESDEQDSEQAYKSQSINLFAASENTKTVRIGQWEVRIYFLK